MEKDWAIVPLKYLRISNFSSPIASVVAMPAMDQPTVDQSSFKENEKRTAPAWATICVPATSANIGCGFDVIGLALSIFLRLHIEISSPPSGTQVPLNCIISCTGDSTAHIPLVPDDNLITRTALYVLRCHGQRSFPPITHVNIQNDIPLSRGLGSSGAAVVAGVMLANYVGNLALTKARMLDYCLMIERHPDNVAAALQGGFVGTYLRELKPEETARKEIPLSEVLPEPAGGVDTGENPPLPPTGIGHFNQFSWSPAIKAVVVIPDFKVDTAKAREVLPGHYSTKDVIFNLQRVPLLISALACVTPKSEDIYEAMQDRIHQPYRESLIPGLQEIVQTITPRSQPGLLGICLSGAGPTILALATDNFEDIAKAIITIFQKHQEDLHCRWEVLKPAMDGATLYTEKPRPDLRSIIKSLNKTIRSRVS